MEGVSGIRRTFLLAADAAAWSVYADIVVVSVAFGVAVGEMLR